MTAVPSALRDPDGARQALRDYGALLGWPETRLGPLFLKEGERAWNNAIACAPPLWLGLAWDEIVRREGKSTAAEQTQEQENTMPVIQPTRFTTCEPGDYSAIVQEIDEVDGEYGPQIQIQFGLIDGNGRPLADPETGSPIRIRGWCSARWGEKTKLHQWAKAILRNRCPSADEPFDTDLLRGRKCDLRVGQRQTPAGPRTVVESVYPYRTLTAIIDEEQDET